MPAPEDVHRDPLRPPLAFGEQAEAPRAPRGLPPRPPTLSPRLIAQDLDRQRERRDREGTERRSILRGLLLLAVVVFVLAVWQFGFARAFPAGWWRHW